MDNPKYANLVMLSHTKLPRKTCQLTLLITKLQDFMLSLVESAAKKEDEKVNKKLAKKVL